MTTTTSPSGSNKFFVLGVAAVVVIGIGLIAVLATQRDSAIDSDIEPSAAVEIEGESLAAMPADISVTSGDTDPAVGQVVPSLTGTNFDGEEVAITADGRPKAVYFLAHWCPHCQAEVPVMQDLIDQGALPEGVDLYAVSTAVDESRPNFPPYLWLDREGFEVPLVRDDADSSAYSAFGAGGFPYVVYLNGDNEVMARSSGELGAAAITGMWQQLALSAGGEGTDEEGTDEEGTESDTEATTAEEG
jgi:thiol-disulfide isomerase/thioredoxin